MRILLSFIMLVLPLCSTLTAANSSIDVPSNDAQRTNKIMMSSSKETHLKKKTNIPARYSTQLRPRSWDKIKHVVTIVLENTSAKDALKQPYLSSLLVQGAYLSQYYAVAHPSQPNYIALVSGSVFHVKDDNDYDINAKHIGNLLVEKGLTWASYAEAYPGHCYLGTREKTYVRKHEPFISFKNVQTDPLECAKIFSGEQFFKDLASNQLPTYAFYVPDMNNDGHDKGPAFADLWLKNTFGSVFDDQKVMSDTLFILTFDEDDYHGSNHVYMLFLGAGVKKGTRSVERYTHYSTLKTIEDIFHLGTLNQHDRDAPPISDIWRPF
jgi:phospholipase C